MSSEKIKRYDGAIDPMDPYGLPWKYCRPEDVERLEFQLSHVTEERDRAVELLGMAGPLRWVVCELPMSAKEWEEKVEVFLSSLTKEKP